MVEIRCHSPFLIITVNLRGDAGGAEELLEVGVQGGGCRYPELVV
jgi:hypothetical protein